MENSSRSTLKAKFLLVTLGALAVAAVLAAGDHYALFQSPPVVLLAFLLLVLLPVALLARVPLKKFILAIAELMDMARTSVNVIGNCLATVVIARWEGEFGKG